MVSLVLRDAECGGCLVGGEQGRLDSWRGVVVRFCSELRMLSQLEHLNELKTLFVPTPAVPYVYTSPSGAGCFCAASTIGSDMMLIRWLLPKRSSSECWLGMKNGQENKQDRC